MHCLTRPCGKPATLKPETTKNRCRIQDYFLHLDMDYYFQSICGVSRVHGGRLFGFHSVVNSELHMDRAQMHLTRLQVSICS